MNKGNSRILILSGFLLLAVISVYWNHFNNGFHFDDSHVIVNNQYLKDLKFVPKYFTDATTQSSLPTNQAYRPVLSVTFALDYFMAGNTLNPFWFQLTTFLWHLLQGALMFFLFKGVLGKMDIERKAAEYLSLFAVGWYLIHTANAETINYISARSDVLSTTGVVAGLLLHTQLNGWKRILALIPVGLAILVKVSAVMYLPIVFVYEFLFGETNSGFIRSVWLALKRIVPAIIICGVLFVLTRVMEPETWVPGGKSPLHYFLTQPFVILRYFYTFFVPFGLSADTDWTLVKELTDSRFIIGTIFLISFIAALLFSLRKKRYFPITFGLAWFILALIPTSSIIPLSEVTNDHRMYFPFVGLVLAATWAGWLVLDGLKERLSPHARSLIAVILMGVILFGNAYGTIQRNEVWSTDENLWLDVSIKSPNNGRGLMNYGLSQMRKGKYDTAIEYFTKAFSTDYGNHPYLSLNMAIAQDATGNNEVAKGYYEQSIAKGKNYPDCHYFYARWLWANSNVTKAEYHVRKALQLSPGHQNAQSLLVSIQNASKNALETAAENAKASPTPENYLNLSLQYYYVGEYTKCISACEEALKLKPDYILAYNNICSAYNELGQYKKAIIACQKALEIDPEFVRAKNNLAHAKKQLAN